MPANLTPQYLEAESRYRAADTNEEKLAALEDMMALIPKHKGTEKMRADIKKRMSKLRQKESTTGASKRNLAIRVEKEGAGQVAVIGPPNSGKSLIVSRLTNADPEVADYPFTTRKPLPGMMEFEDILIQLVDTPPIAEDATEPWVLALPRDADSVLIVVDVAEGTVLDVDEIKEELSKAKVKVISPGTEPAGDYPVGTVVKPAVIAANQSDLPGADEGLSILEGLYESDLPVVSVSALAGDGLERLREAIFESLGVVRVYTKIPGKPADMSKPFILKRGSTIDDLTAAVHRGFVGKLRFARAWGVGKPDGVMIGRDHELEDKDIIELHV